MFKNSPSSKNRSMKGKKKCWNIQEDIPADNGFGLLKGSGV